MVRVVLYTQEHCPPCEWAVEYLTERGVDFEVRDVGRDPEARAELERLGSSSTPTLVIGDQVLVGFRKDRLEEMLDS